MFKCYKCGETFLEPKIVCDQVPYGDRFVDGISQTVCPYCNGHFDTVYECKGCGEYFYADELHSFYCEDCIKEEFDKSNELFEYAECVTRSDEINEFALHVFGGICGINTLLKSLLNNIDNIDISLLKNKKEQYITENIESIAEWLEDKNENS